MRKSPATTTIKRKQRNLRWEGKQYRIKLPIVRIREEGEDLLRKGDGMRCNAMVSRQ